MLLSIGALWPGLALADSAPLVDWSYSGPQGPEHWAELHPSFAPCGSGRLQSPIDIVQPKPRPYLPLSFQYRSQRLDALNTGQVVRLASPPGSALVIRGKAYDLESFAFRVPGEHRVEGVAADAEIQLLHRDRLGSQVVVAVPLRVGERENRILARILDHLPMRAGERVRLRHVGINPLFLLPADRSYYQYTGSLTAPPCTEPVAWYVFREPLEVGPGQIQRIAQATGGSARPVQAGFDRPVTAHFRF